MKKALLMAVLVCSLLDLKAGDEKFQLMLLMSPTVEWARFSKSIDAAAYNAYGSKLSYNFGFEYKRFFDPSLSFSTGIMYMNKGFRNEAQYTDVNGQPVDGVTLFNAHMVAVPLYLNIHHRVARKAKLEMIYTAGLAGGYLFSESVRNRDYYG